MSKKRGSQYWKSEQKRREPSQHYRQKSTGKSEKVDRQKTETIVYMIVSDEESAVSIPYQLWAEPIKSFIKERGAVWCPVFKVWKTSRVEMEFIKRDLPSMLTAEYHDVPSFVKLAAQPIQQNLSLQGNSESQAKHHPLFDKLYSFQRESLDFCLNRHGRILIADEMGIGKSVQSLACSLLFSEGFPLLIICPSALKHVWKDEVLKWLKSEISPTQVFVVKKGGFKAAELLPFKVVIISYEVASKFTNQLNQFQCVICDEAHYLKNPETVRCSNLVPFLMCKKRIFLLTGTPALSKPKQLFNLFKILRPDVFKRLQQFGQRYCERRMNPWTHKLQYNGAKNLAQLHYLLRKTIMIRRLKSDVLQQLPSKQRQILLMETERSVVAEIKDLMGTNLSASSLRESQKMMSLFSQPNEQGQAGSIMRCYMLSGMAKLQSVKEYIGSILQNDIKVIIFAHHRAMMDEIEQHLIKLKYQHIRLDGDVSPQTRKRKVDMFQEESNIKVALLSVTAMGTGFTLTAASTVIFAELHWTPAVLVQAEDRCHRIGQKNAVNIHYLIGDNTLDPIMLRQLEKKLETVGKVLDGDVESMNIKVLAKGEQGAFSVPTEEFKSQIKKITDYFAPSESKMKEEQVEYQPVRCQTQQMKDERESLDREKKCKSEFDLDKVNQDQDSDDSCILQFLRSKRKAANLQQH